MSDFDEVLERLVTDPVFQASLRADPDAALRGYTLDDSERALLRGHLDLGDGTDRVVEDRVNQSGVFGLVGPVVSALAAAAPEGVGTLGYVQSEGVGTLGHAGVGSDPAPTAGPVDGVGTLVEPTGAGVLSVADVPAGAGAPAEDYHTRVDAGRGRWEDFQAVERGDGGVDILVDRDGDGRVDWIGHDLDRDGLLESADYDSDGDRILDTRAVDVDGDGWFDRVEPFATGEDGHPGVATSES